MRITRKIYRNLASQQTKPPFIGALISVYSATGILYAPLTLMGVVTTIYGLWGADWIRKWIPWFSIWHLFGIMVILVLIAMVFFYKVVIPSSYAFQVQQQYKHQNPIVDDLQGMLKRQKDIEKRLQDIEKILRQLAERREK